MTENLIDKKFNIVAKPEAANITCKKQLYIDIIKTLKVIDSTNCIKFVGKEKLTKGQYGYLRCNARKDADLILGCYEQNGVQYIFRRK